jgi:putative redox protein
MSAADHRQVSIERVSEGVYLARNARGLELRFGSNDPDGFSPVELFMASIAGCTAVDVDVVTGRRAEPESFVARVDADYHRDDAGNSLRDIVLTFSVRFPEGPEGDAARAILPRIVQTSHDKTCTVSRTIEAGTPVRAVVAD